MIGVDWKEYVYHSGGQGGDSSHMTRSTTENSMMDLDVEEAKEEATIQQVQQWYQTETSLD